MSPFGLLRNRGRLEPLRRVSLRCVSEPLTFSAAALLELQPASCGCRRFEPWGSHSCRCREETPSRAARFRCEVDRALCQLDDCVTAHHVSGFAWREPSRAPSLPNALSSRRWRRIASNSCVRTQECYIRREFCRPRSSGRQTTTLCWWIHVHCSLTVHEHTGRLAGPRASHSSWMRSPPQRASPNLPRLQEVARQ
jgi:hypothetical protein